VRVISFIDPEAELGFNSTTANQQDLKHRQRHTTALQRFLYDHILVKRQAIAVQIACFHLIFHL